MSETIPYRVELDLFSGPLDLLLYLVRRNEVEVNELPLAQITGQFQEMLAVLELLDLDLIGDFVVMASTLVEVKSRQVLPRPEDDEPDEPAAEAEVDDPQGELITRLLEYKKFKDASLALEEQAARWQDRYPRLSSGRPQGGKDNTVDRIRDVEIWDLVSALGRILKKKDVQREGRIRYDDTPISVYVERIGGRVQREGSLRFTSLFEPETDRSRIVGMFLAVLELLRHHGYRAQQEADYGEILVLPPSNGSPSGDSPREPPAGAAADQTTIAESPTEDASAIGDDDASEASNDD